MTDSDPDPAATPESFDMTLISCSICDASLSSVEAAIDAGWFPSLWQTGHPVCAACAAAHCVLDVDAGEMTLKPGHEHVLAADRILPESDRA